MATGSGAGVWEVNSQITAGADGNDGGPQRPRSSEAFGATNGRAGLQPAMPAQPISANVGTVSALPGRPIGSPAGVFATLSARALDEAGDASPPRSGAAHG